MFFCRNSEYIIKKLFGEYGMSINFFKKVVSNVCIVLVIALVSVAAFAAPAVSVVTGVAPVYKAPGGNKVCLMVNVYWGEKYLDEMLDIFDRNGVKTTFFVGGCWVAKNEQKLKEIHDKGHEIANHGYFHKDHKKLGAEKNAQEISACHNLVKSILGVEMKLFSPPSASFSSVTLETAQKMGYTTVMYSRDTIDWRDKDVNLIKKRATKNITGGELVLMHPTAATAEALEDIITTIKSKGLILTTVSDVLEIAD